ncbi:MAG: hypothetical protein JWP97_2126 [Labilithrix sp.]|nr:hypothetical protein [Labilithrix sp.]
MRSRRLLSVLLALVTSGTLAREARASNVTEFPDNGSEQMGRGGAWVARASDPLATIFNPAGLAGQETKLTLQSAIIFEHTCFTRVKSAIDTTADPLVGPGGVYPRVCNDIQPTLNPQVGLTFRVNDRLGIGLLVIGPSSSGEKTFPDFVNDGSGAPQAAPNRYMLVQQSGIIAFPTIGIGYEVLDNLRLGASFSWGFSRLKLSSATLSLNSDATTPAGNDTRATLQVHDYFVPGFTVGGLYSVTRNVDVAGWYKWSDAIRARGDAGTAASFYTKQNAQGDSSGVRHGDTLYEDCGTGLPTKACGGGQNATVKIAIPMEAKIGVRYHRPRGRPVPMPYAIHPDATPEERATIEAAAERDRQAEQRARHLRDPLSQDIFDLEADVTWANNSSLDAIEIRFPGDATGKGILPVAGVAGGEIPPVADQKRSYKDVIGVRVGGDYNVLPDRLAVRAGAFYESSAVNPAYQNIDFIASSRFGLNVGASYRLRLGQGEKTSAIELMLGYGHVFFADQERTDPSASGAPGLAGTSCNGSTAVPSTQQCADGNPRYRTKWPVNLGTITSAVNVINVGASYRF